MSNMITFENRITLIYVFLDKIKIGEIHPCENGYQYRPDNTKNSFWGDVYPTIKEVKQELF